MFIISDNQSIRISNKGVQKLSLYSRAVIDCERKQNSAFLSSERKDLTDRGKT